jgi:hypothetical protein
MNFPVHGEERLDFHWRVHPKTKEVEGRFKGRIVRNWQTQAGERKEQELFQNSWPEFQRLMALFFSLVENPAEFCEKELSGWSCRDSKKTDSAHWKLELGKKLIAKASIGEEISLTIESFSTNDNKHDRLKIDLAPKVSGPQARSLLTLELFAQSCELSAASP